MLRVPLPRIFRLNTREGLPCNAQFLLLTLKLPSICTDRQFIAHMFTSDHCVADGVPADRRGGEDGAEPIVARRLRPGRILHRCRASQVSPMQKTPGLPVVPLRPREAGPDLPAPHEPGTNRPRRLLQLGRGDAPTRARALSIHRCLQAGKQRILRHYTCHRLRAAAIVRCLTAATSPRPSISTSSPAAL